MISTREARDRNYSWEGAGTMSQADLRKAARFAPVAVADLTAIFDEPNFAESQGALECVNDYVEATVWYAALAGNVSRAEVLTYTSMGGRDYTPSIVLENALTHAESCLKKCTGLSARQELTKRYHGLCEKLDTDVRSQSTKQTRDGLVTRLRLALHHTQEAADTRRWKPFFFDVDTSKRSCQEALRTYPDDAEIHDLCEQAAILSGRYEGKRTLLAAFERDSQIQKCRHDIRQLRDDLRLVEMNLHDEEQTMERTAGRRTGNYEVHARASERATILRRRIADIRHEIHAIEEQIEARAIELGV